MKIDKMNVFARLATAMTMCIWFLVCFKQNWIWETVSIVILILAAIINTLSAMDIVSSINDFLSNNSLKNQIKYRWPCLLWLSIKRLIIILLPGSIMGNLLQYLTGR